MCLAILPYDRTSAREDPITKNHAKFGRVWRNAVFLKALLPKIALVNGNLLWVTSDPTRRRQ